MINPTKMTPNPAPSYGVKGCAFLPIIAGTVNMIDPKGNTIVDDMYINAALPYLDQVKETHILKDHTHV